MKISNINQHHVNTHIKKKHLKLLSLCEFFFSSSETFNPTLTPSTTSFLSMTHFISETVSSLTQGETCLTCSACWPEQLFWQREAPTFAVELTQWNKRLSVLLQTVGFTTPTAKFKHIQRSQSTLNTFPGLRFWNKCVIYELGATLHFLKWAVSQYLSKAIRPTHFLIYF